MQEAQTQETQTQETAPKWHLPVIKNEGLFWVAIGPICAWLGLNEKEQREEIRNHDVLTHFCGYKAHQSEFLKPYECPHGNVFCLQIDYVQGWLYTLDPETSEGLELLLEMQADITPAILTAIANRVNDNPPQIGAIVEALAPAKPDENEEKDGDDDDDDDDFDDDDWAKEFADEEDFDFDLDDPDDAKGLTFALFRGNHSCTYETLESRLRDLMNVDRLEAGCIFRFLIGKGYIVRGVYDDADALIGKQKEKIYRLAHALELKDPAPKPKALILNGHATLKTPETEN